MAGDGYKRRQILVDPDLQVGLSMNILGWLYFYVVSFALLANAPAIYHVLTAEATDATYFESVQRLQWFTQFTVIPLAVTFVCVAVHCVVFTHRVAGPIYRIKATLREMAQRRYASGGVKLREKDYFKDVASEMNTVMDALREDAARQRRMNLETLEAARGLVESIERSRAAHPDKEPDLLALAHLTLDRAERLDRHLVAAEGDGKSPRVPLPDAELAAAAAPTDPAAAPAAPPVDSAAK